MSASPARLGPRTGTRWVIGIVIGTIFAVPLVSTAIYTVRDSRTGTYSWDRWVAVFSPENTAIMRPPRHAFAHGDGGVMSAHVSLILSREA